MATLSIIFNFFLFYYFSPNFFNENDSITNQQININAENELNFGSGESALFWFIVMEHGMLMLKYCLRFILPATPHWVVKEKEYLTILSDDYNKKKEETMNSEMNNYIRKSFLKIKDYVEKETKKNKEINDKYRNNEELIKKYRKELQQKSTELDDAQYNIEILEEKIKRYKELKYLQKSIKAKGLEEQSKKIKYNKILENKNNFDKLIPNAVVVCTNYKSTTLDKQKDEGLQSAVLPGSTIYREDHRIIENKIQFKFDNMFKSIIQQILLNRTVILEDEKESMRSLISKVYIVYIFKNTFERIEREIMSKKLSKLINNINIPIILCNSCFEKSAIIYCWECREKLCFDCKNVHNSNNLWANHKLQKFLIPEYREIVIEQGSKSPNSNQNSANINVNAFNNTNVDNAKNKAENEIFLPRHSFSIPYNSQPIQTNNNRLINSSTNMNEAIKNDLISNSEVNRPGSYNQLKNNATLFNEKTNNNNNELNADSNNINNKANDEDNKSPILFTNILKKINKKAGITKNIMLKETEKVEKGNMNINAKQIRNNAVSTNIRNLLTDKGILFKLEGFYFPTSVQNYNYQNLHYYFEILFREYIDKNGINSENSIETKYIIENQINYFSNLRENPLSIIGKDFTLLMLKSNFNIEEQFFINRVCFMRFKQVGAKLNFHDVFTYLKVLQSGTYEEKLRLMILILDINDSKIILKTEFEKLITCVALQNYSPDFRGKHILELFFGRNNNFLKADNFYHLCVNDFYCKEVMCEILQIYSDE